MCPIPNSSGSQSDSDESREVRDSKSPAEIKLFFKELIAKANSVPLKNIFKFYNVKASEHNRKVTCPFPKHDNGRERTPSFNYYPDTNSFWCFGCKTGTHGCDFVAAAENISRAKAAYKILELYGSEATLDDSENDYTVDYSERLEILMDFSDFIREFIQSHTNDNACIQYIETLACAFDKMNSKHNLDNQALKSLIAKIKDKVSNYQPCPPF